MIYDMYFLHMYINITYVCNAKYKNYTYKIFLVV